MDQIKIFTKNGFNTFNDAVFYFPVRESDKSSLKSKDTELYTGDFFLFLTGVVSPLLSNLSAMATCFVVLGRQSGRHTHWG